jgi:1H-pyrrole-2-carbonyl-[peptidyl-carrier protein] chlorinase
MSNLNPVLAQRLERADRIREYRMDGNYSYEMENFVGEGWMMVGDAAFFVDPIFSSGISNAMSSAKLAAETIIRALATGDLSKASLLDYQQKIRNGAAVSQGLVRLFYDEPQTFIQLMAQSQYRDKMLRICEGDVFSETAATTLAELREVFNNMRRVPR